jgi:hypothetical protein
VAVRAGFGTAPITPPTPCRLAGFAEVQDATEVHDDLTARALYLAPAGGADGPAVCLVVCDLMGMSPEFANPARSAVAAALGLDEAAVLLASTHTHAAPSSMAGTERLGWRVPEGFGELITAGCVAAAGEARDGAVDAELRYGRWSLPDGLSINRRGYPYDPWFSALDVVATDGSRVGALANLAIHPVALGPECLAVSADWVHPFREALQAAAGGTAMLLSGALGDVNPRHVHRQGNDCRRDGFEEAAELGLEVAQAVDAVLSSASSLGEADVRVIADRQLSVPIGGTDLARARRSDSMRVELVEWGIGPVRLVSVPGEGFQELGRQVFASRGERVLLAGLAPLWQGYFPVPFADGYEEGVSYGPAAVAAVLAALLDVPSEANSG